MSTKTLTRQEAIDISIRLWEWLAETGGDVKDKGQWSGWEKYGEIYLDCALCQYAFEQRAGSLALLCEYCPYFYKYGSCGGSAKTVYSGWSSARRSDTRKKYARLAVEQLKALK